jgi:hypothetical protein
MGFATTWQCLAGPGCIPASLSRTAKCASSRLSTAPDSRHESASDIGELFLRLDQLDQLLQLDLLSIAFTGSTFAPLYGRLPDTKATDVISVFVSDMKCNAVVTKYNLAVRRIGRNFHRGPLPIRAGYMIAA